MNQTTLSSVSSLRNTRSLLGGALIAITLFAAQPAQAATYYNNTTSNTWSTAADWSNNAASGGTTGVAPTASDSVVFNQTSVTGATTVNVTTNESILGMTFLSAGTTTFANSGGSAHSLTIGTGGITINSGAGAVTLQGSTNHLNIVVATESWTNNSSNGLAVNNGLTGAGTLTLAGAGGGTISGVIGDGSSALALTVSSGTWDLSGANTYSGATSANGGNLILDGSNANSTVTVGASGTLTLKNTAATATSTVLGASGTSLLALTAGATVNLLSDVSTTFYGATTLGLSTGSYNFNVDNITSGTTNKTITLGAVTTFATQINVTGSNDGYTLAFGAITNAFNHNDVFNPTGANMTVASYAFGASATTNHTLTLQGTSSSANTIGAISDNSPTAALGVIVSGSDTWILNGANTYTSGTTISSGTLISDNATALGTGTVSLGGGTLDLQLNLTTPNNVKVTASSTVNSDNASSGAGTTRTLGTLGLGAVTLNVGAGSKATGTTAVVAFGATTLSANGTATLNPVGASTTLTSVTGSTSTGTDTLDLDGTSTGNSISGIISNPSGGGAIALSKTNSSTWTLGGANTYTGATSISGGELLVGGTGSLNSTSGVTINGSGAKYVYTSSTASATAPITVTNGTLDGTGSVGAVTVGNGTGGIVTNGNGGTSALTVKSLTFNGAGTLNFNEGNTPGLVLNITNALTTTPANGQVTLNVAGTPNWNLGTAYDLISYGSFGGANTDFTIGSIANLATRQSAVLGNTGSGSGNITLTILGDSPVWSGANGSAWVQYAANSSLVTGNWALKQAHTATDFWTGDLAEFDDTVNIGGTTAAPATTTVSIQGGNVSPTSVIFNNSVVTYTIGSTGGYGITGTGYLAKNGTAPVTVSSNNTYTGGTTVNAGTLTLSGNNAFGVGGISVTGGTLILANSNTYTGATTVAGGGALQVQATGALGSSSAVSVASGGVLQLSGSGLSVGASAGTLTINGAGLTGSPAGALDNVTGSTGTNTYAGLVALGSSATIESDAGTLALSNTGIMTGVGTSNLTLAGAGNGSIAEIIGTGGGSVTMSGSGAWTLSGANTYTGGTTISTGTVVEANAAGLGSGTVNLNGGTLDIFLTTATGLTASNVAVGGNSTIIDDLSGAVGTAPQYLLGALSIGGGNTLTLTRNTTNTNAAGRIVFGNVTLTSGGATIDTEKGTSFQTGGATMTGNYNLTFQSTDGTGVASIRATTVAATPRASGTTTLSSGTLSLNSTSGSSVTSELLGTGGAGGVTLALNGGTLNFQTSTSVGAYNTTVGGNVTVNSSTSGNTTAVNQTLGTLSIGANTLTVSSTTATSGTAGLTFGATTLTGNATFNVTNNVTLVNTTTLLTLGAVGGTNFGITKSGNATLLLGGAGTYTGATTVSAGTLQAGVATSAFGSGSAVTVYSGATLDLADNSETIGSLADNSGSGGTVTSSVAGSVALTTGGANTSTSFAGIIQNGSGTLAVTKTGAGTQTLAGANTYTGATTVSAGTLQAGVATVGGTSPTSGAFGVNSAVTVKGTGTLDLAGFSQTIGSLADGGVSTGKVTDSGAAATLSTGGANANTTYSGLIQDGSGPLSLTKFGTGTQILTGTNTYTGATTISAGTLQLGSGSGGSTTGSIASATITDNATLAVNRSNAVSLGAIGGTGALTQIGNGTTTLTATNTYSGTTTISAGTLALGASGVLYSGVTFNGTNGTVVANGTLDISQGGNQTIGNLSGSGTVNLGANQLTVSDSTTQTFSGAIQDGGINATTGGSLAVNGGGKLILSGINNYTGPTSVGASVASVLEYASAGALGSTSGINVGNGSTVQLAGVGTSANTGTITLNGGLGGMHGAAAGSLENVSGVNTLVNPINLAATSDIFADSGSTLNLQGAISNTATSTLFLKGAGTGNISGAISDGTGATSVNVTASGGTWNLSGVNTYSGPTTISAGSTLGITGSGSLGSGSYAGTIANSGTFTYSSSANQTLTGLIKNSGSVVQTAGTLTVTNDNTYSGGTTIKGGTFYADNTNSAASSTGTGNISVGFGDTAHSGTLAGSGFIGNSSTPTTVTVSGGGTISSGDVQPNSPVGVVTGTGLTFTNTSINVAGDAPAILSFALGTDTTSSGQAYDFANPSTNSTYMTLTGGSTLNFAGTDAIALTDLTTGGLALTLNIPYLLVSGVPGDITGLITQQGYGASATYSINGANGFVVGVLVTGSGYTGGATAPTLAQYTTIAINQYGPDGSTPLSGSAAYYDTTLYLENGSLEVVPEPGTWALMLGGLALLIVIQRRKNKMG